LAHHLVMFRPIAIIAAILVLTTTSAFAQFPPPGVYQCINLDGEDFGVLTLLVGGDYQFSSDVIAEGTGQIASSGNSVRAVSGPLADIELAGSFVIDLNDNAFFMLGATVGGISCAVLVD
jgi:hypothetical protein